MPAQLLSLNEGPNILLDKPILLLGRHPECDIQIDSRKISRRHCCIAQVEDYLVVRDLGSTNGIRINGVRVVEGRLYPSDELTVGNARYKVSWDSAIRDREAHIEKAADPLPGENFDDERLEECDEPVPLADGQLSAPYTPKVDDGNDGNEDDRHPKTAIDLDSEPMSDLPSGQQPQAMILPENLELAPASDVKDPPSSHS